MYRGGWLQVANVDSDETLLQIFGDQAPMASISSRFAAQKYCTGEVLLRRRFLDLSSFEQHAELIAVCVPTQYFLLVAVEDLLGWSPFRAVFVWALADDF